MFDRIVTTKLMAGLEHNPAVAILGPRQVGKTTLAYIVAASRNSVYLDLESEEDLAKLQDPISYFNALNDKLVILDEIQRLPEIFKTLRGIIDKRRRDGNGNGQFLILGSASIDLLKQSSESLAGRISYFELGVLNILEVDGELDKLWLRGGLPLSFTATTDATSSKWREDFIRTFLERDVPQFGPRIPATTLRRLWTMVAHLHGTIMNSSTLASSLDISSSTASRYIDLLCDLLLVRKLQPYYANTKKRLVKTPKIYIRDSGLLHSLLNIPNLDSLLSYPLAGASWEGFVIENILSVAPSYVRPYFYRTSGGAEIDLVLELEFNEVWAIEIKRSTSPKVSKGFYEGCEDVRATKRFIVYNGTETFQQSNNVVAIGLSSLMTVLQNQTQ